MLVHPHQDFFGFLVHRRLIVVLKFIVIFLVLGAVPYCLFYTVFEMLVDLLLDKKNATILEHLLRPHNLALAGVGDKLKPH